MNIRRILVCALLLCLATGVAQGARYQRATDGKTLVWNSQRGVAQEATWSGLRDVSGYATGEGTLTWYRLGSVVNTYTGKMVKGKFEGRVIRVQGTTRLQATFSNGEVASGWLEPGESASHSPTPSPNEQLPKPAETMAKPATEAPSPFPTPAATPRPTPLGTPAIEPTAIPTPKLTPTPRTTPTATPKPTPTPTSTPRPTLTPAPPTPTISLLPTATPVRRTTPVGMPVLLPTPKSTSTPSALTVEQPSGLALQQSGPVVEGPEGPVHSLELEVPASPAPQIKREEPSRGGPSSSKASRISPSPSAGAGPGQIDAAVKKQMIADLRKQSEFVLGEAREATGNFRPVDRLDQVKNLPPRVSAHVSLLANQAREFRDKLGYQVTYYECLAEMQAVDTLVVLDEATGNLADKDTPAARKTLSTFKTRYSEPTAEAQKPLWRYLVSLFSLCDRLKNEAETHLPRALSLETSGKKSDALRELREVYQIYPNPVTAEKIRQLENQLHAQGRE